MLPVKHLALKILMSIKYCGYNLAHKHGCVAPAYLKKEGATLILECTNMTGGLIGALMCGFGCGI